MRIHVCDPDIVAKNPGYPAKLNDAEGMAKFVCNVLPAALEKMRAKYGWAGLPRVVVHDKASYMVTAQHDRLHVAFAAALTSAGFSSWVGGNHEPTDWLAPKFGDVYLHETVISHIRRLLDTDFSCKCIHETVPEFKKRMQKVEDYMNSKHFKTKDGRGLEGLAKDLLPRCHALLKAKGERLPK